ncbi:hypothetical protein FOZ61_008929 [Perkinsus olseni]|uniref:Uncharacterized protein n=1 Tax=Perkinsus olseni TaxID=32597 RepID=A0A7J6L3X6_PEROL|nr:hypothetical protein FOZ61_008929 [Perkinsus olseni]
MRKDLLEYRRPATASPEANLKRNGPRDGSKALHRSEKVSRRSTNRKRKEAVSGRVLDRANLVAEQGTEMLRAMHRWEAGEDRGTSPSGWGSMTSLGLTTSASCGGLGSGGGGPNLDARREVQSVERRTYKRPPSRKNGAAAGLFNIERITDAFEREPKHSPLTPGTPATLANRPPSRRGCSARRSNPALLAHINGQVVTGGSWAAPRSRRSVAEGSASQRPAVSSDVGAYISDDEGDDDGILVEDCPTRPTTPSSNAGTATYRRPSAGVSHDTGSSLRSHRSCGSIPTARTLVVEDICQNGVAPGGGNAVEEEGNEIPPPNFCADENEFSPPSGRSSSSSCGETVPLSVTTRNGVEPLTLPLRFSKETRSHTRPRSKRSSTLLSEESNVRPRSTAKGSKRSEGARIASTEQAMISEVQRQSRPDTSAGSRGVRDEHWKRDDVKSRPHSRSSRGGGRVQKPQKMKTHSASGSCAAEIGGWSSSSPNRGNPQALTVPFSTSLDKQFLSLFAT